MCFNACTISTCNSGKPKINPTYQNWQIDEEYFQALRNPLKLSFLSFSTEFFQHLKNPLKLSFFLHRICSKRKDPLNLPLCLSFFLHRICSSLEEPTSSFLSFFKQFVKTLKNPLKHSSFLDRICSKRKKTHSRFLSFFTEFVQFSKNPLKLSSCLHWICSKRKKFHSSIPFSSPDLFSAPAAASIPQVTPPKNYTEISDYNHKTSHEFAIAATKIDTTTIHLSMRLQRNLQKSTNWV